jgi:hypothetical protein
MTQKNNIDELLLGRTIDSLGPVEKSFRPQASEAIGVQIFGIVFLLMGAIFLFLVFKYELDNKWVGLNGKQGDGLALFLFKVVINLLLITAGYFLFLYGRRIGRMRLDFHERGLLLQAALKTYAVRWDELIIVTRMHTVSAINPTNLPIGAIMPKDHTIVYEFHKSEKAYFIVSNSLFKGFKSIETLLKAKLELHSIQLHDSGQIDL